MIARRRATAIQALRIVDRLVIAKAQSLLELALVAGQHDVGGFTAGSAPVDPASRDAADVVDVARLIAPWNQVEVSAAARDRRMRDGSSIGDEGERS